MDCRTTSTRRRRAAMTLVEILIATGLVLTLVTAIACLYVYFIRTFAGMENYMTMDMRSRYALDRMSKEIRQADLLLSYATNKVTLQVSSNKVSFTYDPTEKTLTRAVGSESEVLLTHCDYLR